MSIVVYTDGSSLGNPGPGGRGVIIVNWEKEILLSGWVVATTNNRMELQAVIETLLYFTGINGLDIDMESGIGLFDNSTNEIQQIHDNITIVTDSTYVQKWVTERLTTRVRRNWRRSKGGKLIENVDLRQQMHTLLPYFTSLERQRVKGHAGHEMNEKVDDLARSEAEKQWRINS